MKHQIQRTLNVLVFALLFAACGASQREKTLKATLVAINVARDGFLTHDDARQTAIVVKATSLEDGKTQLAAYRLERVEVVVAFELAYKALATALLMNDNPSVIAAGKALAELLAIVKRLQKLESSGRPDLQIVPGGLPTDRTPRRAEAAPGRRQLHT